MDILVRCELDAVINHRGEDQLLAIRTFNQSILVGADTDWKRKLERQSAAVLAIEAKNNSNKVARWTLSALLGGCDMMKVGFTTRVSPKDSVNHQLLVTQMQKPKDLAVQLNINLDNCWAIVRSIVDLCFKLEKENYLLMKDPNKQLLYLYETPPNAFATQYDDDMDMDSALPSGGAGLDL
jgi:translation initiation factor 3 subunit D